ncbi:hypothetical protein ACFLT2_02255 [Acidobacteriota bacterium]
MVLSKRTHIILILIFLMILFGCKESVTTTDMNPIGTLSSYEGCKTSASTTGSGSSPHVINEECIAYEYDGEGHLVLKHINSGFNCCPEKINADIFVSGDMIYIEEREEEQGCLCQCLFDVKYEVHDVMPGDYTIEIKGPYIIGSDEELKFRVLLNGSCSGTFCVTRTHYPWNTQN